MKAVRHFLELIKFEHTLFALPFAYLGMLLGSRRLAFVAPVSLDHGSHGGGAHGGDGL